jgi:hypothetical protein
MRRATVGTWDSRGEDGPGWPPNTPFPVHSRRRWLTVVLVREPMALEREPPSRDRLIQRLGASGRHRPGDEFEFAIHHCLFWGTAAPETTSSMGLSTRSAE